MATRKHAGDTKQTAETKERNDGYNHPPEALFPIVGIGASAGGLSAIESFFSALPVTVTTGMAFVIVQHLAPDHKSILSELVKRFTQLQVHEVEDGVNVRPDCIYVIPPNRDLALINGILQLLQPVTPRVQRMPIDFFFRSLARDRREGAVCIILSGTGSDGTGGARAIKSEGGMVMVQKPESAEFDGMPCSAIASGMADYVLAPNAMPARLMAFFDRVAGKKNLPPPIFGANGEDVRNKIFVVLRTQTGHDFSQYKQNTINRRIERRMAVHRIGEAGDYLRYLQQNPNEVEALFRDLLIGVTSFFRDPEAFKALENQLSQLLAHKEPGSLIRVWTPGCSTGEESYSIAILIQEQMERLKQNFIVQVFATDIDSRAIDRARAGIYPAAIASDISPERLGRYFTRSVDGTSYRINKTIRDMLIFSEQDVIKDPPFSRLDVISCRNLLIYMDATLQKNLSGLFYYALNPGGMLFLGTSESIGNFSDFFAVLDRQAKLYLRKGDVRLENRLSFGRFLPPVLSSRPALRISGSKNLEAGLPLRHMTEQALLNQYTPVALLINQAGEILYLHGRSGRYLEPSPGEPGMNILKMAREGLRRDLTTALHKAATNNETVRHSGLWVKTNGSYSSVHLTVQPVTSGQAGEGEAPLFLVILEDERITGRVHPEKVSLPEPDECGSTMDSDIRIAALKQDLQAKEEFLQTTIEELETSNEELKSSNEEMQSINEELQSTNEELETSKEELQSVNEELATVNAELQAKVADLSQANNDMNNLLSGTGVGTVFVDLQIRIQRYTPAATHVINLITTDVGRPLGHTVANLVGYEGLVDDVRGVLETLMPKETEVQTRDGVWYLLRIRPYRTLGNVIEGAVLTFVDISEMVASRKALHRLAVLVQDSHDALTLQDLEGQILAWNPAAEKMYGWSEAEALDMNICKIVPEEFRNTELENVRQLSNAAVLEPYHTQRIAKNGTIINVCLTATSVINSAGQVYAIATTERAMLPEASR